MESDTQVECTYFQNA